MNGPHSDLTAAVRSAFTNLAQWSLATHSSKAAEDVLEQNTIDGNFLLPGFERVGSLHQENGKSCDVFLASGFPFPSWPRQVIENGRRSDVQPIELFTRTQNYHRLLWNQFNSPLIVAMPRLLRSATTPLNVPAAIESVSTLTRSGRSRLDTVPKDISRCRTKLVQVVLDKDCKLVDDVGRVKRGDPESPAISCFRFELWEVEGETASREPDYEAVICAAIVKDHAGRWVPWKPGRPVRCPLFTSPQFQWSCSSSHDGQALPSIHSFRDLDEPTKPRPLYYRHSPPADPELRLQGNLPIPSRDLRPKFTPLLTTHLPFRDPGLSHHQQHSLSHRQRRIYQQDYARFD